MRAWKWTLGLVAVAMTVVAAGCTQSDPACEDENQRLKQRLIQFEHDSRNQQSQVLEAQAVASRYQGELAAANRQIALYQEELPRLRALAKSSGGTKVMSDKVQQQLEALAAELGGAVVGNRLELPGDFFFDSGKYELTPAARSAVRRMVEILRGENLFLMIVGHTDNDPVRNPTLRGRGINDNLHLSLLRSKAVLDEMQRAGYPPLLMYPTGWGELRPIAPNTSPASKKLNRRVEILVDPAASNIFGISTITGLEPIAGAY